MRVKRPSGKFPDSDQLWRIVDELRSTGERLDLEAVLSTAIERGGDVGWQHLNAALSVSDADPGARIPPILVEFLVQYFRGRRLARTLDPWAGAGVFLTALAETGVISSGFGISRNNEALALARLVSREHDIEWRFGDPFDVLDSDLGTFDLVISSPPFGMPKMQWEFETPQGQFQVRDDAGYVLMLRACTLISEDGEAVFTVPDRFFIRKSHNSALRALPKLGLSVHTVLSIPDSAAFLGTSIPVSLVFVKREVSAQWFVGKIANNPERNGILLENIHARRPGQDAGLGRLVVPAAYYGYRALESADRVQRMTEGIGLDAVPIDDVALEINLAKRSGLSGFEERPNAVYLPLIGHSDAVSLLSELSLKPHNYAQLVLDPQVAEAEYVAGFFNTPLGLAIREQVTSRAAIPRISKGTLEHVNLFLPDRKTQLETIAAASRVRVLVSELQELRQRLWAEPKQLEEITEQLTKMLPEEQREERFADWIDSLPFPLASILWTYHASDDHKQRYEHLLHFFEALSEFMAIVLLSGIANDDDLFQKERDRLSGVLARQHLSFDRATFGTWKTIVERLAKVVRTMVSSGDDKERGHCQDMFRTHDKRVLTLLSSSKLVETLQETNRLRNNWTGHGGIVSKENARERHELLEHHLASVREVLGAVWERYEMILPGESRFASGVFEYKAHRLMGTRTPFEVVSLLIEHPLEDGQLYLVSANERSALRLLPLVKVMPSPEAAQNACYFYNRRCDDGLRFVSYHFETEADIVQEFADTADTLRFLSTTGDTES